MRKNWIQQEFGKRRSKRELKEKAKTSDGPVVDVASSAVFSAHLAHMPPPPPPINADTEVVIQIHRLIAENPVVRAQIQPLMRQISCQSRAVYNVPDFSPTAHCRQVLQPRQHNDNQAFTGPSLDGAGNLDQSSQILIDLVAKLESTIQETDSSEIDIGDVDIDTLIASLDDISSESDSGQEADIIVCHDAQPVRENGQVDNTRNLSCTEQVNPEDLLQKILVENGIEADVMDLNIDIDALLATANGDAQETVPVTALFDFENDGELSSSDETVTQVDMTKGNVLITEPKVSVNEDSYTSTPRDFEDSLEDVPADWTEEKLNTLIGLCAESEDESSTSHKQHVPSGSQHTSIHEANLPPTVSNTAQSGNILPRYSRNRSASDSESTQPCYQIIDPDTSHQYTTETVTAILKVFLETAAPPIPHYLVRGRKRPPPSSLETELNSKRARNDSPSLAVISQLSGILQSNGINVNRLSHLSCNIQPGLPAYASRFGNSNEMNRRYMVIKPPPYRLGGVTGTTGNHSSGTRHSVNINADEHQKKVKAMGFPPPMAGLRKP